MILFDRVDTRVEIILTLTENVTAPDPVYDFVFTHVLTKKQVLLSLTADDDLSDFTARYNAFMLDTTMFDEVGEWHYTAREQQTGTMLEQGKMMITRDFNYKYYAGTTSYRSYSG